MKERKCRRTLASLSRLRMNKEDDERDARGDLSSAIVSSVADEESTENSDTIAKTTPKVSMHTHYIVKVVKHAFGAR